MQDYVTQEFTSVYGPDAITSVHLITFSPKVNKLVQQYNTTRSRLQDLLDHYHTQLQKQAAAAAAAAKRLRKQQQQQQGGNRSNPVKVVGRAVGVLPAELPRHVVSGGSSISSNGVAAVGSPVAAVGGGHSSSSNGGWWHHRSHKVKPIKILQVGGVWRSHLSTYACR